ncbi:MAG: peptidylprolyl isomerase [Endomicrobiales bacterium]|nr:peptidylprolyl isomerase [Endomicrobiales bacterium]
MFVLRYLFLALLLFIFSFNYLSAKVVDRTLAIVNGEAIMLSEFDKIVEPVLEQYKMATPLGEQTPEKTRELKQRLLDQMIDDRILKQEARNQKIRVSKRDVEEGIKQVKSRFTTESEFQSELKKEDISMVEFEKRIKEQLMVMKLTEQEIKAKTETPTEEQTKKLFDQIKAKMDGKNLGLKKEDEEDLEKLAQIFKRATSEQIRASHILIQLDKNASMKEKSAALKKIKEIKRKLDNGADFRDMVEEYSEDSGSANRGGDLGYFAKGDMVPEFEKAAFSLDVGGISEPVLTDFGYHIIKVEEKRASRKFKYEDAQPDLQQYLYQKNAQKKYEKWIEKLRSKATIKINELE